MEKRINNISLGLGLLALVYAFLFIPEVIELWRQPAAIDRPESANYIASFMRRDVLGLMRNTISGSGSLLGFAALVEITDRIRRTLDQANRAR